MPRRPRSQLPRDGVFHVIARGVDRCPIVRDPDDWEALLGLVLETERRFGWLYDVFTLMSTHFHLVIRAPLPQVSSGMHRLNGVYAQRFNRRWGRVGHLFANRFQAWVMRDEAHWEHTCRYVLDNPVKAGLCELPSDWPWSGGRFRDPFATDRFGHVPGTVPGTWPARGGRRATRT